jgi:glycosyltransferase involved in cell wall biosynthesis
MAFGLPIITRPVGGVKDFFKNEEHGFASTSKEPQVIADSIEKLLLDQELYSTISLNNYHYAQSNFLASDAALRLEKIYESLLRDA